MDQNLHNDTIANDTSAVSEETIHALVQLVAHFETLLGILTLVMLVAMNGLIIYLNHGKLGPIMAQKNLLLCALLLSTSAMLILNSVYTTSESQPIYIACTVATACAEVAYISFSWVRTREILRLESHRYVYLFFYYFCLVGQIICWAPIFAVAFAAGPSRTLLLYIVNGTTGLVVVFLDCYFAIVMGTHLVSRTAEILESKGPESRGVKFYPIIASHQFVASLAFFSMILFYAGEAFIDVSGRSITSLRIFYGCSALFNFSLFGVMVCNVLMKVRLLFLKFED
ncbi:hypothetical protein HDU80_010776 [Chytriomyces hyalinus]|nr:hypothetical protein HDU80_010776 [Chytriomyces hyalinus]